MAIIVGIGSSNQKYQGVFVVGQARVPLVGQSWLNAGTLYIVLAAPPDTTKTPGASLAAAEAYWQVGVTAVGTALYQSASIGVVQLAATNGTLAPGKEYLITGRTGPNVRGTFSSFAPAFMQYAVLEGLNGSYSYDLMSDTATALVVPRAVNYYATGVPDAALLTLQAQLDWLFTHRSATVNQVPVLNTLTASNTTPTAGTAFTATATATAFGTVASVEFFLDGISRGVATNGPNFSLAITPVVVGTNRQLTAQATDNLGAKSAISNPVSITVNGANTAPGTVASLTASPASTISITLAWAAPANGGSAITDYLVEYRTGAANFAAFLHTASTATTSTVTGLTASTAYDFRVSAINAIGTGTASAIASATTPAAPAIASFAPASGFASSTVVITGTSFTGATLVSINGGVVQSFAVNSATQITAVLTSAQTSGLVRVTTPGGTAVSSGSFTVTVPAPTPLYVDDVSNMIYTTPAPGTALADLGFQAI